MKLLDRAHYELSWIMVASTQSFLIDFLISDFLLYARCIMLKHHQKLKHILKHLKLVKAWCVVSLMHSMYGSFVSSPLGKIDCRVHCNNYCNMIVIVWKTVTLVYPCMYDDSVIINEVIRFIKFWIKAWNEFSLLNSGISNLSALTLFGRWPINLYRSQLNFFTDILSKLQNSAKLISNITDLYILRLASLLSGSRYNLNNRQV